MGFKNNLSITPNIENINIKPNILNRILPPVTNFKYYEYENPTYVLLGRLIERISINHLLIICKKIYLILQK